MLLQTANVDRSIAYYISFEIRPLYTDALSFMQYAGTDNVPATVCTGQTIVFDCPIRTQSVTIVNFSEDSFKTSS